MVHEALAPTRHREGAPLDVRFVSNVILPSRSSAVRHRRPPHLLVIVSKTFTTQETMANARRALHWLEEALGDRAGRHLAAVSSNVEGAAAMGISADRVFGFATGSEGVSPCGAPSDWPSRWGPVQRRSCLVRGARAMDHIAEAEADHNVPLHLALIELWNTNILGHTSRVVLPHAQALHRLPAYLQQAEMESMKGGAGMVSRFAGRRTPWCGVSPAPMVSTRSTNCPPGHRSAPCGLGRARADGR